MAKSTLECNRLTGLWFLTGGTAGAGTAAAPKGSRFWTRLRRRGCLMPPFLIS